MRSSSYRHCTAPPILFEPILAAVAHECEDVSLAEDVRATIMLPTMHQDGSRIVVYSYNMDGDADQALVLGESAGCSGRALKLPEGIVIADLDQARRDGETWNMNPAQANQVPADRKTMISVVIPAVTDISKAVSHADLRDAHRVGVLSVDTSTTLESSKWKDPTTNTELIARLFNWAKIIGRLLSA